MISRINDILTTEKHPMRAILDLLKKEGYDDLQIKEYLDSIVNVNLWVDTGDGECDFTYNTVCPSSFVIDRWDYSDVTYTAPLNNKASIVWLAKQQGYTKEILKKHLYGEASFSYCLYSIMDEVNNQYSVINPLCFTMGMKLKDLIIIVELKQWHKETGKWGGYLILNKDAVCGFYEHSGNCGLMEICLEQDVKLQIKYLFTIYIDDKEDLDSLYNTWEDHERFWENQSLMRICAPRGFKKIMPELGYDLNEYSEIFEKK